MLPIASMPPTGNFGDGAVDVTDLIHGAVHCWHFDIDETAADPDSLTAMFPQQDRHRSGELKHPASRWRFVACRAALRIILGRYLSMEPGSVPITNGPHGKPQLAGSDSASGLIFNLSHTADRAVLAVAWDGQIGIDLQVWRQFRDVEALLRRCCADSEQAWVRSLDPADQPAALFRLWTLKEAFCKANGRGLAYGLNRCIFDCTGPRPRLLAPAPKPDDPRIWHFAELPLPTGISGAVALDRPMAQPTEFKFDFGGVR